MSSTEASLSLPTDLPELGDDVPEEQKQLLQDLLDIQMHQVPLKGLVMLVADQLFGEKIDDMNEELFLNAVLDETQPVQSDLFARIAYMFDQAGYHEPDHISIQVFRRKAGFIVPKKERKNALGKFSAAICVGGYQQLKVYQEKFFLQNGDMSKIFDLEEGHPFVPKNNTKITTTKERGGYTLLKPRDYLNFLIWVFWAENPKKTDAGGEEMDTESLRQTLAELDKDLVTGEDPVMGEDTEKVDAEVIYEKE